MTAAITTLQTPMMEGRYRLLVDAITDYATYMLDTEGYFSSWNSGAQRSKGYREDEILGQHFSRFYLPEDRHAGLPARALATAASEGRFESEGWRIRKNGERYWAHVVIDAIRDPSGQLLGFAKITRDLSERKRAEVELKRSEKQFRLLVQGVTDYAIYILDPSGQVASWNAGAQRIKGCQPDEIIRKHFSSFELVVTDQAMPGMTGSQLAAEIKQIDHAIPIILATGYAELPEGAEPSVQARQTLRSGSAGHSVGRGSKREAAGAE